MLYGLDLFSGIGGISLALEEWVRPVAYCENDRYAQGVLISRMADGSLPVAPIWDDITTLRAEYLPRGIDIIYGGFPCQDISVAGNRIGLAGERSGLIREVWRLADEIRPRFIFLENVPAIVTNGFGDVLTALAERRFAARWLCLSAFDVGACHIRNRWWLLAANADRAPKRVDAGGNGFSTRTPELRRKWEARLYDTTSCGNGAPNSQGSIERNGRLQSQASMPSRVQANAHVFSPKGITAYSNSEGLEGWHGGGLCQCTGERATRPSGTSSADTDCQWQLQQSGIIGEVGEWSGNGSQAENTECERLQELEGWRPQEQGEANTVTGAIGWPTVAAVCGADDGIQHRVDRIKCLGNSVVPQCAKEAFKRLMGIA